jgi:hypothetical protein
MNKPVMQSDNNKVAWLSAVESALIDFADSNLELNDLLRVESNRIRINHMFEDGISAQRAALGLMPANTVAKGSLVNKVIKDFKNEYEAIAKECEHSLSMFRFVERRLESIKITGAVSYSWLSLQLCDGEFLMNMAIAGSSNINSRSIKR